MLNVEGNIFIGGVPDLNIMTAGMFNQNFVGCLGEVELNGQRIDLMANAIDGRNVRPCGGYTNKICLKIEEEQLENALNGCDKQRISCKSV
uniref:Laminin G domain-containing protein n=1 Tax=Meloidogyne floridensis TaxID=298350 RepID=A0A915NQF4_9BILA